MVIADLAILDELLPERSTDILRQFGPSETHDTRDRSRNERRGDLIDDGQWGRREFVSAQLNVIGSIVTKSLSGAVSDGESVRPVLKSAAGFGIVAISKLTFLGVRESRVDDPQSRGARI